MRIAFVSDVVYPYVKGGAEKRIFELSRRLAAEGHDVHLYGIRWWDGPAEFSRDGITYHGVCDKRDLYRDGKRSITEAVWFGLCLLGPLTKERFDVIDCNQHPYFSLFSCKAAVMLRGGRFLATWHEVWGRYWTEYMGWAGMAGRAVEWLTARLPDHVISVSNSTAADLESIGVPRSRITVIPNGIPLGRITEVPPAGEASDVAFAGRLIKDKHVDVLLRACGGKPLSVTIIGDGPERAALEALAKDLGVNAVFTGFLPEEALIARLKAAKLFVLPSAREGFSITTLEALACGVPVVTVDEPRNYARDLVADGVTGRVVPLDEESIGHAIQGLLPDEAKRKAMSAACAVAAAAYDWDGLASRMLECYRR
jgi:glycosyltransferase involved in cell wall biosynthesis